MVKIMLDKRAKNFLPVLTVLFVIFFSFSVSALSSVTVTSPNGGEYLSGTQSVTWDSTDCVEGETVNLYYGQGGTLGTWNPGTTILIASNVACSLGTYSWSTNGKTDTSNYRIKIRATSDSDIYSISNNFFTIDNTLPAIGLNTVTTPTSITAQTISGTFTETNLNTITVNNNVATIVGGTYSYSNLHLSEGSNTITVVATDLAGNSRTTTSNIVLDTIKPTVGSVVVSPSAVNDANGALTVTVNFVETGTGMNNAVSPLVEITGLSGAYTISQTSYTGTTWVGSVTITDNNEEAIGTISVKNARDNTGNIMNDNTNAQTFAVDTITPSAVTISVDSGNVVTKDSTPVLTLTAGAVTPNLMQFSCDSSSWSDWVAWSTSYDSFNIVTGAGCVASDGAKTIYVKVKDNSENIQSTVNSDGAIYDSDNKLTVGASGKDFTTIQAAINAATAGDTIEVSAGTYTEVGQIVISKNLNIVGADRATTIIKTNQDTGSSGDAKGWWVVNSGIAFNLSKVTLDGTGYKIFHGIRHKGTGTIQDVYFTNLQYNPSGPDYAGFAIYAFGMIGDVNVSDSSFDNIGREGIAYWGAGTTGIYSNNTYTGKGVGNWLDYGVEVTNGAVVTITGSTITNNLGVATVDGSNSAGIIVLLNSRATILDNTLNDNYYGINVGYATGTETPIANAHNNIISGNDGIGARHASSYGTFNATNNYWGCPTGPGTSGCDTVSTNVDYTPWAYNSNMNVDTTVPTVILSNDHADTIVRDADTVIITATFTETGSGINEATKPKITIGALVTTVDMTMVSNTVWTYSWNVPSGNNGAQAISIVASDVSGNANSAATGVTSLTIDNTAPVITITNPNTNAAQSKTITATGEDGTLTMSITTGVICDGTLTYVAYDSNTFSSESDNGKKVCYRSIDVAGNIAYSLSNAIAGIDRTAPTITITNPTTSSAQTKTIIADGGDGTLTMFVNAAGVNTCDISLTFEAYSSTTFTSQDDNTKTVCYRSTDAVGNIAYKLSDAIAGIDTTKPTITIINPDTSSAQSKTITADGGDGTLTMFVNAAGVNTCDISLTFEAYSSTTFTSQDDNTKNVCYRSTDVAGNIEYKLSNAIAGIDTTKPTIDNVVDITLEATSSSGAIATFATPLSRDVVDGDIASTCDATSGSTFAIGVTTVTCSKTDVAGNIATPETFTITVSDTTKPTIDNVVDITLEATSSSGAIATFATPLSRDVVDGNINATCNRDSGDTFALGITTVTCSKTDAAGNAATSETFTITVQDRTAPTIDNVADITLEATSSSGAVATFATPLSRDVVDGNINTTCNRDSGDTFALGITTVTCSKTDAHSNAATPETFTITVQDITAPTTSDNSVTAIQLPGYTVTISPSDVVGVASTKYCMDNVNTCTPTTDYVTGISFSTRGVNYLRYFSTDAAGNSQTIISKTININQLPNSPAVTVSPTTAYTTNDLTCNVGGSTDADLDSVVYSYSWFKGEDNQTSLTTNTVLATNTAKGEVWKCRVTPGDGREAGAYTESSVTISNTAPVASSLSLTPSSPLTTNDLTASYTYADADSDANSGTVIKWYKNDIDSGITGSTVLASATTKGDVWYFTVTPSDGTNAGETQTSSTVTIGNTIPANPTVDVTPNNPYSVDNLTCTASGSTDADSDSLTYVYKWYKNNVEQVGLTTNTVSESLTTKDDFWNCYVVATDGTANSGIINDSVKIGFLETHAISLSTTKTKIAADGASTATLTATLRDGANNLMADGTMVEMSTTQGSLSDLSGTTSSGQIQVTLTSAATTGVAVISFSSYGVVQTINVTFSAGSFGAIALSSNPSSVDADGADTTTITAQMQDVNGNDIASAGETISFATTKGLFSNGATTMSATTNVNGQAVVVLTGPSDGTEDTATITASKGTTSKTLSITINAPTFDDQIVLTGGKWNLISVPKTLANSNVGSLFSTNDLIYYYDASIEDWVYKYLGSGTLSTIDPLKGYWVKPSVDKTLSLTYETIGSGVPPVPPSQDLAVGWNLIGHGTEITSTVSNALSAVDGKYSFVLEFNTATSEWKTYSVAGVKEFTTMKPGYGYWVFMKESGVYASGA